MLWYSLQLSCDEEGKRMAGSLSDLLRFALISCIVIPPSFYLSSNLLLPFFAWSILLYILDILLISSSLSFFLLLWWNYFVTGYDDLVSDPPPLPLPTLSSPWVICLVGFSNCSLQSTSSLFILQLTICPWSITSNLLTPNWPICVTVIIISSMSSIGPFFCLWCIDMPSCFAWQSTIYSILCFSVVEDLEITLKLDEG